MEMIPKGRMRKPKVVGIKQVLKMLWGVFRY